MQLFTKERSFIMLKDWQEFITSLKKQSKAVFIWCWHEEKLAIMNRNLAELRRKGKWIKNN